MTHVEQAAPEFPRAPDRTPWWPDVEGSACEASARSAFLLDADRVWIVRAGRVDLFSVRIDGGRPAGPRTHLLRGEPGDALVGQAGAGDAGYGLLAVGSPGTSLVELSRETVADALDDPARAPSVHRLLETWIAHLHAGVSYRLCPPQATLLAADSATTVAAGSAAQPDAGVRWVRPGSGGWRLGGDARVLVEAGVYFPLARPSWIATATDASLDAVTTEALDARELWAGLRSLHASVLRLRAGAAEEEQINDGRQMSRRGAARRALMETATIRLAASSPAARVSHAPVAAAEGAHDALFAAFRCVAEAAGLTATPPPQHTATAPLRDPLAPILAASRLRLRRVALRGDWWRRDHGPLLAQTAEGTRPVAAIWTDGRYALHDPTDRTVTALGAEAAATLAPFAHTIYRPFPDRALRVQDLLQFGLQGCRRDLRRTLLLAFAATLLGMVPAMATASLFNTVIPGAERSQLLQLTLILVVCALSMALFNMARGIALLRIEGRMGSAVQAAVWDRLLGLPLSFFRPYTAGDLAVRAMSIDAMRQTLSATTVSALIGGALSLGNFALMFYYSAGMAWRATLLIAVAVSVTIAGGWLQLRPQRAMTRLQARTQGLVLQLLSSINRLRVSGAEVHAFALWADRFSQLRRLQYRSRTTATYVAAFNGAFPVAAHLVIFWTAFSALGAAGGPRTGDFLGFLSAFSACLSAVLGTSVALLNALNIVPLYEQAQPILQTLPEVDGAKAQPGDLSGDLEVHHAVFRYRPDGPAVLRDVSLHVRPGEFVALAGPSGSGKSTLMRLLLGFETLESGSIYFDGQEIGGVDLHALRRQMGVVLQSGRLMAGDILTNIAGAGAITLEEAWEAARMAGFADDVKAMPMGMHTVISEGGGTLSGGQRQRLMIARAIVHRPRILLFDEATSALDNRTQAIVSASLDKLRATRIVVAHRLSTIVNADRIFVFDRGQIVESGSYAELMRRAGLFATLARRQIH